MKNFIPENTNSIMYIKANFNDFSLAEIVNSALEHFQGHVLNDLMIRSEYIHCRCLGYDQFDGGDYDNYIIITSSKNSS
jgi:hypothetical protein